MGTILAQWVIRWRFAIVVTAFLALGIAASGGRFLGFTTDYRVFFSADNPQLQAFETLQNTYTKYDNILFVLAPNDSNVFSIETLSAVAWLTEQSWQIPYSIRVDSLSNFQHSYAVGDELVIGALVPDTAALHTEALARIRAVALSEPLLVDRLVAAGGEVTGVNVTVQLPGLQPRDEVPEVVAHARHLTAELLQNFPGINVHLTGIVMFNNAFPEATQHDMRTLVPAMFAVVILTLGIMLRIVSGILATLLVIGFSILAAMGARVGSACSSPDPPLLHPQLSSPWPWPIARTY